MTKQEMQVVLGQNLRKCRLDQRLTIEKLSEKVGISVTFYSNLESGKKMMSVETLWKLTDALSISADTLLHGGEPESRIKNIELLLENQSPEELAAIEELIRFWIAHRTK